MAKKNYTKDANGNTLIGRPRFANETIISKSGSKGYAVDKDASTFSLATIESTIAALKSIYDDVDIEALEKVLKEQGTKD